MCEFDEDHQACLSGRGFLGLPQKGHLRHDRTLFVNVGAQCHFIFGRCGLEEVTSGELTICLLFS